MIAAVVTHDHARLWTDGRYFAQARQELDTAAGWQLMQVFLTAAVVQKLK
jgi:hypothetical protein